MFWLGVSIGYDIVVSAEANVDIVTDLEVVESAMTTIAFTALDLFIIGIVTVH
jgi:hypothetical protein